MNRKAANSERVTSAIIEMVDVPSRTIFLCDEINDNTALQLIVALRLLDLSKGKITIVLSSSGGYDNAGWAIFDSIRQTENVVRIEGFGHVLSMAAVILQAGDERYLAPNCSFMVHVGSISDLDDDVDVQKLEAILKTTRMGVDRYIHELANKCDRPVATVRKEVEAETYLSAPEAVRLGYADGLLPFVNPKKMKKRKS